MRTKVCISIGLFLLCAACFMAQTTGGKQAFDAVYRLVLIDTTDATKKATFTVNGVTTGTTRTIPITSTSVFVQNSNGPTYKFLTGIDGSGVMTFGLPGQITVVAKNIALLTSGGSPADVATIPIPYSRWMLGPTGTCTVIAEGLSGTAGAASWSTFDLANGAGNSLGGVANGPAATTGTSSRKDFGAGSPASAQSWSTGTNLYIRQNSDSANTGTVSFYITIIGLP